ncbi:MULTISPECIES: response regulator transcription factor [unclassified Staphylococcus]|uniref:response regulator transcription factor n=1 Tax=unclassified Staphylococcus TaxID=91994 RepID=UPI0021CF6023|nr:MULTISPECIES: response regulator transcription factor [unclassified Staphylococcus]UXR71274.1 response regulator transcription factor [Staphylococcus sp. IVB6240]UXR75866.1 response regulator transcription factor [Staphylococcus sp. IVB6233]UXR80063.1 response regulator transcription factor [Staphylococcus sp. IVB6218]
MAHILIIEDDEKIARVIELELEFAGYQVTKAYTGRQGLNLYETEKVDLILLDVMIPELNGLEVLRRIRMTDTETRIIMLTARDTVMDKVGGLDSGANDYMTKPFEIEELLARIRVHLKDQQQDTAQDILTFKNLQIYTNVREVYADETYISLTQREYDLLYYFVCNKNQVLAREQIIAEVWGFDYVGDTNIVDVYVRYIRKKLGPSHDYITSVRGIGYVLKDTSYEA